MNDMNHQLQFNYDIDIVETQAPPTANFTKATAPIQRKTKCVSVGDGYVEAFLMAGEPVFIFADVLEAVGRARKGIGPKMQRQLQPVEHFVRVNLEGKGGKAKTVLTYAGLRQFLSISSRCRSPRMAEKPAAALKSLPSATTFMRQLRCTDMGYPAAAYRRVKRGGSATNYRKKIAAALSAPCQPLGVVEINGKSVPAFRRADEVMLLGGLLFDAFGFAGPAAVSNAVRCKRISRKNVVSVKLDRLTDGGSSAPSTAINIDGVMEFLATSTHPNAPLMRTAMAALKQALSEDPVATLRDLPEFIENGISN